MSAKGHEQKDYQISPGGLFTARSGRSTATSMAHDPSVLHTTRSEVRQSLDLDLEPR